MTMIHGIQMPDFKSVEKLAKKETSHKKHYSIFVQRGNAKIKIVQVGGSTDEMKSTIH